MTTQSSPTYTAADLQRVLANIAGGSEGITAINTSPTAAGQGVGGTYDDQLATYMQNATNGLLANTQGTDPSAAGYDPVLAYFLKQGDLTQSMTGGDAAATTYVPGPNAPSALGTQGYGTDSRVTQLDNANPFGTTVQGALDLHNVRSPQQAPQAFGHNQWGPIEATGNLAENQDVWSRYVIPLMQTGMLGAAGGLGMPGILNAIGGAMTGPNANPLQNLDPMQLLSSIMKIPGMPSMSLSSLFNG